MPLVEKSPSTAQ